MAPQEPEDWPAGSSSTSTPASSTRHSACMTRRPASSPPGDGAVAGVDGVRHALAGLIGMGARLHGRVVRVITAGDVALLYTDWESTAGEAHKAIELLRRQPDGTWKLIVGDPRARG